MDIEMEAYLISTEIYNVEMKGHNSALSPQRKFLHW